MELVKRVERAIQAAAMLAALILLAAALGPATATGSTAVSLVAGQHTVAGTVSVWVEGSTLYVRYTTVDGWVLGELHLEVAGSLEEIPQTRTGNPVPGRFSYKASFDPAEGVTSYTFLIPLDGLDGTLYIAAHAEVYRQTDAGILEETAWAEGQPFPGNNWAMYFTYTPEQQPTPITM